MKLLLLLLYFLCDDVLLDWCSVGWQRSRQTVAHENDLLVGAGLPAIQLVDLRADAVTKPAQGPGELPDPITCALTNGAVCK